VRSSIAALRSSFADQRSGIATLRSSIAAKKRLAFQYCNFAFQYRSQGTPHSSIAADKTPCYPFFRALRSSIAANIYNPINIYKSGIRYAHKFLIIKKRGEKKI
jgi:hypothetical protein